MLDRFIDNVCAWCLRQDGVVGLALVGSHARDTATEHSDVDLIILSDQNELLIEDPSWVKEFGQVIDIKKKHYGKVVSLHTRYEYLPEIEFGISDSGWVALPLDEGTKKVILDGIRVIYDPHELLKHALNAAECT